MENPKPIPWNIRAMVDLTPDQRFCTCCGQRLAGAARMLELDQRTQTYHDFGGVPESKSQGSFPFGLTCSRKQREKHLKVIAQMEGR